MEYTLEFAKEDDLIDFTARFLRSDWNIDRPR